MKKKIKTKKEEKNINQILTSELVNLLLISSCYCKFFIDETCENFLTIEK